MVFMRGEWNHVHVQVVQVSTKNSCVIVKFVAKNV